MREWYDSLPAFVRRALTLLALASIVELLLLAMRGMEIVCR